MDKAGLKLIKKCNGLILKARARKGGVMRAKNARRPKERERRELAQARWE